MSPLDRILSFLRLTHAAHKVERVARIAGETRYATMVEHSWQLAMLAWYVIDTEKLPLNKEKVLRYALAHDLVEAYAGDTYSYNATAQSDKKQREQEAQDKIAAEHPEFEDLLGTMQSYEAREDEESQFVYALDKMIDPLNIYLEDGLIHQEKQITFEAYRKYKEGKVQAHPLVYEHLYKELNKRFEAEESKYFFVTEAASGDE